MSYYQRDAYYEKYRRAPGYLFGFFWLAATVLGSVIGRTLADQMLNAIRLEGLLTLHDLLAAILVGLVIGIVLGAAQSIVLFSYFKVRGTTEWIAATTLGLVVRSVVVVVLTTSLFSNFAFGYCLFWLVLLLIGFLAGITTGYAQKLVLDRRVAQAGAWIRVNAVASALTILPNVIFAGDGASMSGTMVSSLVNGFILGAFTVFALRDLISHPSSQAEWRIPWKTNRPPNPTFDPGVQPSPEALLDALRTKNKQQ